MRSEPKTPLSNSVLFTNINILSKNKIKLRLEAHGITLSWKMEHGRKSQWGRREVGALAVGPEEVTNDNHVSKLRHLINYFFC